MAVEQTGRIAGASSQTNVGSGASQNPSVAQPPLRGEEIDQIVANPAPQGDRIGATPKGAKMAVPESFGAQGGSPIANKDTILTNLWKSLGHDEPPMVAYIFVKPARTPFPILKMLSPDSSTSTNPYGHSAVAYRRGNELQVVNMTSKPGMMVTFMPAEDYIFGTDFEHGASQGGVYNRAMVVIASWDVPAAQIDKLDAHYRALAEAHAEGTAHFSIAFPVIKNIGDSLTRLISAGKAKADVYGNCALHATRGLEEAGILEDRTMWPKKAAYDLIEEKGVNNLAVVDIPVIPHAYQTKGIKEVVPGWTSLGLPYGGEPDDLSELATVRVEVPVDGITARIVETK